MKHIVVSPSGKMYGSEQVLIDYLKFSKCTFLIFVCGKDLLYRKLKNDFVQHVIRYFSNPKILYFRLFLLCLAGRVSSIYINEAGHSKYILVLARSFPSVRFIIHVRLVEDTKSDRWPFVKPANLYVVSVSQFVKESLPVCSLQVYDPYIFHLNRINKLTKRQGKLNIGVIGRISVTKGIDTIIRLLNIIEESPFNQTFQFHFFGDLTPDVIESGRHNRICRFSNISFHGFERDVDKIFDCIDCVIHGSACEPLGRIFLEAVDFGKPFIGINEGGIGEIGRLLQLNTLLINKNDGEESELLFRKLLFLVDHYESLVEEVNSKRDRAAEVFSSYKYAQVLDSLAAPYGYK